MKDSGDVAQAQLKGVQAELDSISKAHEEFLKKEAELERMQALHPRWDVDNISHEVKSRTIINKDDKKSKPSSSSNNKSEEV
jgi:hypothetical protein